MKCTKVLRNDDQSFCFNLQKFSIMNTLWRQRPTDELDCYHKSICTSKHFLPRVTLLYFCLLSLCHETYYSFVMILRLLEAFPGDSIITGGFTNKIRLSLIKREYCVKKIHALQAIILYYMEFIQY